MTHFNADNATVRAWLLSEDFDDPHACPDGLNRIAWWALAFAMREACDYSEPRSVLTGERLQGDAAAWRRAQRDKKREPAREKLDALFRQHADVISEWARARPGTRPAAWWAFYETPGYARGSLTQAAYLARHGLLSPEERRQLPESALKRAPPKRKRLRAVAAPKWSAAAWLKGG